MGQPLFRCWDLGAEGKQHLSGLDLTFLFPFSLAIK